MATRYAVATGNWSNVATWDGGVSLPATGDTVHANGFTVTIDQDVNVGTLSNNSNVSPAIAANGTFQVSTTRTITCTNANGFTSSLGATTVPCLLVTAGTVTLSGNAVGGSNSAAGLLVSITGGTVNWTGNIDFLIGTTALGCCAVTGSGVLNLTGNITSQSGGNSSNAGALLVNTSGAVTVVGNVTRSSSFGANSLNAGIQILSGSVLTVTGTVSNPASQQGCGIYVGGAATVTINGNVTAGTYTGILCASVGSSLTVNGDITAGSAAHGIISPGSTSIVKFNGDLIDHPTTGQAAVYAVRIEGAYTAPAYWRFKDGGSTKDLVTTDSLSGLPAEDDVRSGTLYGASSEFEGTMAVPDPATVVLGVPVDATTGTAVIDPADVADQVWDFLAANATTPGSMGERLKNVATVDAVGALLAAP